MVVDDDDTDLKAIGVVMFADHVAARVTRVKKHREIFMIVIS